jgi:hypothetical protein
MTRPMLVMTPANRADLLWQDVVPEVVPSTCLAAALAHVGL